MGKRPGCFSPGVSPLPFSPGIEAVCKLTRLNIPPGLLPEIRIQGAAGLQELHF